MRGEVLRVSRGRNRRPGVGKVMSVVGSGNGVATTGVLDKRREDGRSRWATAGRGRCRTSPGFTGDRHLEWSVTSLHRTRDDTERLGTGTERVASRGDQKTHRRETEPTGTEERPVESPCRHRSDNGDPTTDSGTEVGVGGELKVFKERLTDELSRDSTDSRSPGLRLYSYGRRLESGKPE